MVGWGCWEGGLPVARTSLPLSTPTHPRPRADPSSPLFRVFVSLLVPPASVGGGPLVPEECVAHGRAPRRRRPAVPAVAASKPPPSLHGTPDLVAHPTWSRVRTEPPASQVAATSGTTPRGGEPPRGEPSARAGRPPPRPLHPSSNGGRRGCAAHAHPRATPTGREGGGDPGRGGDNQPSPSGCAGAPPLQRACVAHPHPPRGSAGNHSSSAAAATRRAWRSMRTT